MKKFSIILAVDDKNWLWKNNDLAWRLKWDMKFFKDVTSKTQDLAKHNAVIMWRKTWDSIPQKFRPLPQRINCVLTRKIHTESSPSQIDDFVLYFNSLDHCLDELNTKDNIEEIFIIWWSQLYNQVLDHPDLEKIFITQVQWDYDCDVFFDWIPDNFTLESKTDITEENTIKYNFNIYTRKDS
jgi:dihydrofolate reductase